MVMVGSFCMPLEGRNKSFWYKDKPHRQVADCIQTFLTQIHLKEILGSYTKPASMLMKPPKVGSVLLQKWCNKESC